MHTAFLLAWLTVEALAGFRFEARASGLRGRQPEPGSVGLTAAAVRERLGRPTDHGLGVWSYRRLRPGANTVVPATLLRLRGGRVVEAASGLEMVGCIIAVPRP